MCQESHQNPVGRTQSQCWPALKHKWCWTGSWPSWQALARQLQLSQPRPRFALWRCPLPSTAHLFCPQAMCLLLKKFLFQTMLARDWGAWRPLFLGLEFAVCDFLRGTIPFLLREVMTNPLCKYKTSSNFWCYKRKDRNLVVRGLVYMPSLPKVTLLTPSQWWLRSSCKQGFDAIHVAKLRVYP